MAHLGGHAGAQVLESGSKLDVCLCLISRWVWSVCLYANLSFCSCVYVSRLSVAGLEVGCLCRNVAVCACSIRHIECELILLLDTLDVS